MALQSSPLVVSATARLAASPQNVYATIANYHTGHPKIVPKQFSDLTVERGGIGAGTIIRFNVTVLGRRQTFRAEITEPEPGRVLVERNFEGSTSVTTFIVVPGTNDRESDVTIQTEMPVRSGLAGALERFITSRVLKPMYAEELRRLETQAQAADRGSPAPVRA